MYVNDRKHEGLKARSRRLRLEREQEAARREARNLAAQHAVAAAARRGRVVKEATHG